MSTPIIILLALQAIGLLLAANKHGQQKEGKYNFWIQLLATAIILGLYYWAGVLRF